MSPPTRRTPPQTLAHAPLQDRSRRRLLQAAALAGATGAAGPALAQTPSQDLRGLLAERLRHQGVALAAARVAGDAIESAAIGPRSSDGGATVDRDQAFEIGSITKTFVALLLAQRVRAGAVTLEGAVEDVLPNGLKLRDRDGAPLRWVDLATHRSGLPRLPANLQPRVPADPYADYDDAALYAFLAAWRPQRSREAAFEYSNLGFGLLGHALALQAGTGFEALLRREVLAPLGLDDITVAHTGAAAGTLVQGHDAQRRAVPPWHFGVLAGAGALRASLRAMQRYAMAACGAIETPLAEAFALTMQPRGEGPAPGTRVGLAWFIAERAGRTLVNHDGGTFGFSSSLFVERERRRAGLVLANAMVPINDLALHLVEPTAPLRDVAADAQAAQAPAVTLPPAALAPLAGVYAIDPRFKITVTVDGGRLFAQATGQGAFELFARGPRQFFARVTALQITFEGEAGPPPALELQQAGQRLRFVRE